VSGAEEPENAEAAAGALDKFGELAGGKVWAAWILAARLNGRKKVPHRRESVGRNWVGEVQRLNPPQKSTEHRFASARLN
jgi:hypothetical protein